MRNSYLELNKQFGEYSTHLTHELFHELCHLLFRDTFAADTQIEWVLKVFFIVSSEIQANGYSRRRSDTIDNNSETVPMSGVSLTIQKALLTQLQQYREIIFHMKLAFR